MKQFTIFILIIIVCAACNKQVDEIKPLTKIDQAGQLSSVSGIVEATTGNYLLLKGKDRLYYDLCLQDLSENRGNNVMAQNREPVTRFTDAYYYRNSTGLEAGSSADFYKGSYLVIVSVNASLEGIETFRTSQWASLTAADQNKVLYAEGENRFLRAFTYFNMVRVYGKPYYLAGNTDLSVPLKTTSSINDNPASASVKDMYNFITAELQKAAQLMKAPVTKTNSFASTAAAWSLLSRVYLYMGGTATNPDLAADQLAAKYADSVITQTGGTYALLQGSGYYNMFGDDETGDLGKSAFAANKEIIFALDNSTTGGSTIGLLYHYYSDIAMGAIFLPSSDLKASFAAADVRGSFFKTNSNSGYSETTKWLCLNNGGVSFGPYIFLRLGEVYLNRAEAYAKSGNISLAREDLKMIHVRAGLQASDIDQLSNDEVLAAILKERRMEMAFEGHNSFDYYRNGLPMIRSAADFNGTSLTVQPEESKVVFTIPNI